jgi:4-hydroxy-3-polyprenylbenzoate decarboxylase
VVNNGQWPLSEAVVMVRWSVAHLTEPPRRLIVAMTGASGSIFGVRLLQQLRGTGIETHLVMSRWAARTLVHETPYTPEQVQKLADVVHPLTDQGASISSGSFLTMGMVVAPCSARTLAAIAHGIGDNLIHRAADVVLKERRKLVLAVRESPLSEIHLENMLKLSRMGVVISPPLPAFYTRPASIDEMVDHSVSRILDQFGIHLDVNRWSGEMDLSRRSDEVTKADLSRRSDEVAKAEAAVREND